MVAIAHAMDTQNPVLRLAVLIDADNSQATLIEPLLAEIAGIGEAIVRRIYGDFTSSNMSSWKKVLQNHAMRPQQQFAYSKGKSATDSALIIDAMDLLYTGRFDGFCLITSDSDLTSLAMRIRESGLQVFGFGEEKTPSAFRNACTRFVSTQVLREPDTPAASGSSPDRGTSKLPALPGKFIREALDGASDDSGWCHLGTFGQYLSKRQPDFDTRRYGHRKLSHLVRARTDLFEVDERVTPGSVHKVLYVRAAGRPGAEENPEPQQPFRAMSVTAKLVQPLRHGCPPPQWVRRTMPSSAGPGASEWDIVIEVRRALIVRVGGRPVGAGRRTAGCGTARQRFEPPHLKAGEAFFRPTIAGPKTSRQVEVRGDLVAHVVAVDEPALVLDEFQRDVVRVVAVLAFAGELDHELTLGEAVLAVFCGLANGVNHTLRLVTL